MNGAICGSVLMYLIVFSLLATFFVQFWKGAEETGFPWFVRGLLVAVVIFVVAIVIYTAASFDYPP